jgi:hypothetical protein
VALKRFVNGEALFTVLSGIATAYAVFSTWKLYTAPSVKLPGDYGTPMIVEMQRLLEKAAIEAGTATASLKEMRALLSKDVGKAPDIAEVRSRLKGVEDRMRGLEQSLVATPATSLALPLLRKDVDVLRERIQSYEVANRQRELESADNLKTIGNAVVGLLAAVLGGWVQVALSRGKTPPSS